MDLTYNVYHPASYEDFFLKKLSKKITKVGVDLGLKKAKKEIAKTQGKEVAEEMAKQLMQNKTAQKAIKKVENIGTATLATAIIGGAAAALPAIAGGGAGAAGAGGAGAAKGGLAALGAKGAAVASAAKAGADALKRGDTKGAQNAVKSIGGDKVLKDLTSGIVNSDLTKNLQEIRNAIPKDIQKEIEKGLKKGLTSGAKKVASTIEAGRTNAGLLPKTRPLKRGEEIIMNGTAATPTVLKTEIPTYVYFIAGFVGLIILFMVIKMLR